MTHHAYYIEGSGSQFESYKAELKPFFARAYERFGVDEARELIALAALKNYQEAMYLIATSVITSEAQQALLKLFEEPQQGTVFVLLVPHGTLLPTLKSRMLPFETERLAGQNSLVEPTKTATRGLFGRQAAAFLKSSGKARSDIIATLLKDDEGVRERVRDFIDALEIELTRFGLVKKEVRDGLHDLAMVRTYLADRSPSLKMLLEHLALALP